MFYLALALVLAFALALALALALAIALSQALEFALELGHCQFVTGSMSRFLTMDFLPWTFDF